ncbi:hypothetical protein HanIR_Chr03g0143901 [Helianthus annuus]|nr:hypothetical protein HanIR_Chr03g0143901 [Helianthus annuus]
MILFLNGKSLYSRRLWDLNPRPPSPKVFKALSLAINHNPIIFKTCYGLLFSY